MSSKSDDILKSKLNNSTDIEDKFHALFESMAEGVALHEVIDDENGKAIEYRIVDINPAYELHTGAKREEVIGKLSCEAYKTDQPPYLDLFTGVAKNGKTLSFETYFPPMDKFFRITVVKPSHNQFATIFHDISEIIKRERELKDKKEELENFFNISLNMLCIANYKGYYTKVNKKWTEVTGYSIEELLGVPFADFLHPDDVMESVRAMDELSAGRPLVDFKNRFRCKDGHYIWIEWNANSNEDGQIFAAAQDITDKINHQEEQILNRERLAALLKLNQQIDLPIFDIAKYALEEVVRLSKSQIGYIATVNEEENSMNMISWSRQAMNECSVSNKPILYKISESGLWGESVRQRKSIITNDYEADNEYKRGLPAGHVKLKRHLSVPIFDEEKVVMLVGVGNKVAEYTDNDIVILTVLIQEMWKIIRKKQIEEALDNERERLAVTLRSIGDGVIATDTNGIVVLMNRVSEDLTGWKQADAIGKPLHVVFNIINEITREVCENPVEKVLRVGGAIELPARTVMIAKDGTERMVADSGAPIRDRRSLIIGVVLVFRDVTEENRLYAEMQKITKLESLGVLAGGLAHDFNNMLTVITGSTGLAAINLELNKSEKAAKHIADAEVAAIKAKDLTQQLLTFARGGTPLRELIYLTDLIQETATFALSGSRTRCNIDIPDDMWMVNADAGQISQVFHNLLLNADQAMPQGGIVNITCRNITLDNDSGMLLPAGHYVKIDVADEGIGIPVEMQDKIFDPFFTTKQRGSGLGLASVFSIIRGHEGHVTVSSKAGVGSTFSVYLAAVPDAKTVNTSHVDKHHKVSQMKILVMDDERIIAIVLTDLLEGLGHKVGAFGDGKSALAAWKYAEEINEPYDMGIFDLTVPGGMGGDETLKNIHILNPEFMAIATSGYATDPIMTNYSDYGFVGRLAKPYRIDEMVEIINTISERKMNL